MSDSDVDVVIIGGGVNGTGVARDLAMRGAKVVLFEKNDLAFGASGNSSGMIHGGARYLTTHPKVTESSCRDSGYIQQIAPFLLFRIPFLMPVAQGSGAKKIFFTLLDAFFRAYDDYQPLKHSKSHTRLSADELSRLEPGIVGDMFGAISFDEWGIDGARLCTLNALDASQRGAKIAVHTEVVDLLRSPTEPKRVSGVRVRDTLTQSVHSVTAKLVVNASGAWGPITSAIAGVPLRLRPGKGIHVVYDRRLSNYAIATNAIDGRQVFLEPWENMSVLGTTDDDYYGDLDDVRPTADEVRYLVQAIAAVFPAIRTARPIGIYTGVRPTLYTYGPQESDLSREHEVVDHARHGARGLYSMIGGKLASYRIFAEEMTDILARELKLDARCRTHEAKLPGADQVVDALKLAQTADIAPVASRRLVYRHGSRAQEVVARLEKNPAEARVVCPCEPVLEGEIRQVLQTEFARTVDDVSRRTRLGLGACGGMRCALRCGQIVAEETGCSQRAGRLQALRFLSRQRIYRAPALSPDQARQESLALGHLAAQVGLDEVV